MVDRNFVSTLVIKRDINGLVNLFNDLCIRKMKLDKFFTNFLSSQGTYDMMVETTDTPLWDEYKEKRKEYTTLDEDIKYVDFKIKKLKNV